MVFLYHCSSGIATGGQGGGAECPLDSDIFAKNREKEEKSGMFFHFALPDR